MREQTSFLNTKIQDEIRGVRHESFDRWGNWRYTEAQNRKQRIHRRTYRSSARQSAKETIVRMKKKRGIQNHTISGGAFFFRGRKWKTANVAKVPLVHARQKRARAFSTRRDSHSCMYPISAGPYVGACRYSNNSHDVSTIFSVSFL